MVTAFTIGIRQILKNRPYITLSTWYINGIFQLLGKTPNLSDSFAANLDIQEGRTETT